MRIIAVLLLCACAAPAQSIGAGTVGGKVADPSGAIVVGAVVTLQNPLTNYRQSVRTDGNGVYRFTNVPLNSYHLGVSASGFAKLEQDVAVRSTVPLAQDVELKIAEAATTTIDVQGSSDAVLALDPSAHNDVDQSTLNMLPTTGSGLSDAITLSTPGVVADSNGFFHPQGDHAQTSYVVDGQPISDQQSKAFSTQMPENAFQLSLIHI